MNDRGRRTLAAANLLQVGEADQEHGHRQEKGLNGPPVAGEVSDGTGEVRGDRGEHVHVISVFVFHYAESDSPRPNCSAICAVK